MTSQTIIEEAIRRITETIIKGAEDRIDKSSSDAKIAIQCQMDVLAEVVHGLGEPGILALSEKILNGTRIWAQKIKPNYAGRVHIQDLTNRLRDNSSFESLVTENASADSEFEVIVLVTPIKKELEPVFSIFLYIYYHITKKSMEKRSMILKIPTY